MMKTNDFSKQIKIEIAEAQNGYCVVPGCHELIHSIHHKLHNTEYNRRKFPLFIQSPFNGVGLCYNHHTNEQYLFRITEKQAELYEHWLEDLLCQK